MRRLLRRLLRCRRRGLRRRGCDVGSVGLLKVKVECIGLMCHNNTMAWRRWRRSRLNMVDRNNALRNCVGWVNAHQLAIQDTSPDGSLFVYAEPLSQNRRRDWKINNNNSSSSVHGTRSHNYGKREGRGRVDLDGLQYARAPVDACLLHPAQAAF